MSPTQRTLHTPKPSIGRKGAITAKTAVGALAAAALAALLVTAGLVAPASADAVDPTSTSAAVTTTEATTTDSPAAEVPAAQTPTTEVQDSAAESVAPESTTPEPAARPAQQTPPAEPVAPCIPDSGISYLYDKTDNSGSITVTDAGSVSGTLCRPLYVSAVSWTYTTNATWPQKLDAVNYQLIEKPGTYPFSAPVTCGQGDVYVHRIHYIVPTPTIDGPQLWEDFLNTFGFPSTTPGYTTMLSPLDCFGEVTPVAPAVTTTEGCGTYGTVTPQVTDGVVYATKFDKNTGVYAVTATPAAGKHFAGDDQSVVFSGKVGAYVECTTVKVEGDPEAVAQVCNTEDADGVISGYITVAPVDGVNYTIHPVAGGADITVTSVKTPVAPGTYVITAHADAGVILIGDTTWTRTVDDNAVDCDIPTLAFLPASVGHLDPTCGVNPTSGAVTIDPADGVTYSIGSRVLTAARTPLAPGSYTVTATAPAGDTIDGQSVFPIQIAAAPTDCGQLTTLAVSDPSALAFTGVTGTPIYLTVSAFLMLLGGGLLVWNRRRKA